ncbi:hypothetical protein FOZ61_009147 [Perkinsus olseni]|uniref:Lysophosphatidic acid phosphatase type 6 n=1 Tax=Perkinsus olseni TaxID=32597 RepID=A0A7J6L8C4_PEROL|nr:hypothetical protein FOZ61_009147 [Perkinsus olseni]KAF4655444.1 hypothetical protein FOL46_008253 [Perkinsus olseni]
MLLTFLLPLLLCAPIIEAFPEDEPLYYCHADLKWPTPPFVGNRGSTVSRVLTFVRHGSRVLTQSKGCWEGDETVYSCSSQTFSGYERLEGSFSPKFLRVRGDLGSLRGNCILGQLVDSGIDMQIANGQALRNAYGEALKLDKSPANPKVMIRADDCPRTIESAQALTMGMFPNDDGNNTAFEVVVPDRTVDGMEPNPDVCPAFSAAERVFLESKEAREHVKNSERMREKIGKITGRSDAWMNGDPANLAKIYGRMLDCLMSHACSTVPSEPKKLPTGLEIGGDLWNHIVNEATFWSIGRYQVTPDLLRYSIGPLIRDVFNDLTISGRSFSLYSGHDTGPMGEMLSALGLRCSGIANIACAYDIAPSDLQAYLPVAYSYFAKTEFMKDAMKFCGIATVPQLMKIMGCAHIASAMSIFFQPVVGALWMLITMIGAEYVSDLAADIPGMPNHDLCGKSSPICPATHALHLTIAVMSIVVMVTGTPVCSYCVGVFGQKKKSE